MMILVRCIEQISLGGVTFKAGENYTGNTINKDWWVVDSVGITTDDFHLHFEELEELTEVERYSETDEYSSHERQIMKWPEPNILLEWLGDKVETDEYEEEDNSSWLERLRDYIFA